MMMPSSVEPPRTSRSLLVRYRARITTVLFLLLLPALVLHAPRWDAGTPFGYGVNSLGYVLIVGGVLVRLWSTLYIGGRKSTALQTGGPYSLVRHPLYLGSFLLGLGLAALAQSLTVLAVVAAYFALQYTVSITFEEKLLCRLFGDTYATYRKRVPCLLPNFRRYVPHPIERIDVTALRDEMRHALVYLAIIPLMEGIALLHLQGVLPGVLLP